MRLDVIEPPVAWCIVARAVTHPDRAPVHVLGGPTLTDLQRNGVARARVILGRYGGVIVADSVGMGKTHIGVHLVGAAVAEGAEALIVVPAMLRRKWRDALRDAGFEPGATRSDAPQRPAPLLTTHTSLHQAPIRSVGSIPCLVLVDEAHQFRNPATARYRALARLTATARVVLLTATPINNRPADLYWLLRLFLGDGDLQRAGIPDLRAVLLNGEGEHDALVHRITRAVIVRRTREDWTPSSEAASSGIRFPTRHPPGVVRYEMEPGHLEWIEATLDQLGTLRLSAFDVAAAPSSSSRPRHRSAASALVRIGLLKRLESSSVAFRASVMRLLSFLHAFEEAVRCGSYLRSADIRSRDPLQLSLTHLLARPLPRSANARRLAENATFDIDALRTCIESMPPDAGDPKTRALADLLGTVAGDRCVVFTEFAETADALFHALLPHGIALLHGTRCALPSGPVGRRVVLERFAPAALDAARIPSHESVRTLIATDVLAEGVDLQAARHCISYDLPWNPVRLMQRAGRIDRLGSPHRDVFVWYFTPAAALERMLGLMRRLALKTHTIERMIGAEHGAGPNALLSGGSRNDPHAEPPPWRNRLRELVQRCPGRPLEPGDPKGGCVPAALLCVTPDRLAALAPGPKAPGGATVAQPCDASSGVIVLTARERANTTWVEATVLRNGTATSLEPDGIARLLCHAYEDLSCAPPAPADADSILRDALMEAYRGRTAGASGPVAAAAIALRQALLHPDGGADAALCRRAERVLRRLGAGLPAGRAMTLERLLGRRHALAPRELVRHIDQITWPGGSSPRPRLTGLLVVVAGPAASSSHGPAPQEPTAARPSG